MALSLRPCVAALRLVRRREAKLARHGSRAGTAPSPGRSFHLTPSARARGADKSAKSEDLTLSKFYEMMGLDNSPSSEDNPPSEEEDIVPDDLLLEEDYRSIFEFDKRAEMDELRELGVPEEVIRRQYEDPVDPDEEESKRHKPRGFFAEGEEDDEPGDDPDFEADDISSLAHGELEQVRELRELERVIAWDMPLLHQHAQPFAAPTAAQPLRWKYTTFLGETHPAARKVVLEFSPAALPGLTPAQATKLTKLLGPRVQPAAGVARLSCQQHATAAQNKAALGALLERLCAAARDPADSFADIPLDTRHARPARRAVRFPKAWRVTPQRQAQLERARADAAAREAAALEAGSVVEGARALGAPPAAEEEFVPARARQKRR